MKKEKQENNKPRSLSGMGGTVDVSIGTAQLGALSS